MKIMRKIICILFIVIFMINITACDMIRQPVSTSTLNNETMQPDELLKDLSEDSLKMEQKFLNADIILDKFVQDGRILIREFDEIHPQIQENGRYDTSDLGMLASDWRPPFNFAGAHYDVGALIHQLCHTPDDYYMFYRMDIDGKENQRRVELNIFFTKDFQLINMSRYSKMIKVAYGIDIYAEELKNAVIVCEKELPNVTYGNQYDHILYEKNDILIKMVTMEDITRDKYIAICARYTPQT